MSQRKQHHLESKAKLALESLKGEETVSELTRTSALMGLNITIFVRECCWLIVTTERTLHGFFQNAA